MEKGKEKHDDDHQKGVERTEQERQRGLEKTRRDKAEGLHQHATKEPAARKSADKLVGDIKELVDQYDEDISVLVINEI